MPSPACPTGGPGPSSSTESARTTLEQGVPLTVAMLDLDHFKDYNDQHGHPVADELLAACAKAWGGHLAPTQFLARYGGEEFAVLLPGIRAPEAFDLLDRLREATPGGQTVSIGDRRASRDRVGPVGRGPCGPRAVRGQGGGPQPGRPGR